MLPRLSAWLLTRTLAHDERDCVLGDLAEEHRAIEASAGRTHAHRWFRQQLVISAIPNVRRRLSGVVRQIGLFPQDTIMINWHDLRYALRGLRRAPGFTIPAVLTLALGMGAATAVFTVVHRVVLRPLSYPASERLVRLWDRNEAAGLTQFSVSPAHYFAWQSQSKSLASVAALREDGLGVRLGAEVERIGAARVTATLFDVLGIEPAAGRRFLASEDRPGAAAVTILSDAFARRVGNPRDVVGRSLVIDGRAHEVIGVMPHDFVFPVADDVQLLVPYALDSANPERAAHFLRVIGRTMPDSDVEAVRAEMAVIAASLDAADPASDRGWTVRIENLREATVGGAEATRDLFLLFGASGLLLLVTCVNVGGLWMARAAGRQLEMTMRSALGAGRGRLIRLLVAEGLVISTLGAGLGLVFAWLGLETLLAVNPDALPRQQEISLDAGVFLFSGAMTLVVTVFFGLTPAFGSAGGHNLRRALADGGRVSPGNPRARRWLVAGEIAMAVTLVAASALVARHLIQLTRIDPGFAIGGVTTMALRPPAERFGEPATRAQLFRSLTETIDHLPGVVASGAVHRLPLLGNSSFPLVIEGQPAPAQPPSVNYRSVAGRYFEAMDAPIVRGRTFTADELQLQRDVIVINRAAADQYFVNTDPVGRRLRHPRGTLLEIIGVVQNMREDALDESAAPALYFPYANMPSPSMILVVRGQAGSASLGPTIRHAVQQLEPTLALSPAQTMQEHMDVVTGEARFQTLVLMTFAVAALLLAAVGVYGVTAGLVVQRTPEIGLRVALGATPVDVFRAIVAPGLRLSGIGVALGLLGAVALAWSFGGTLFGIDARQPWLLIGVGTVLFIVAVAATVFPARRAMRLDALRALRSI
jgi:putative ABC transport system permease protein